MVLPRLIFFLNYGSTSEVFEEIQFQQLQQAIGHDLSRHDKVEALNLFTQQVHLCCV